MTDAAAPDPSTARAGSPPDHAPRRAEARLAQEYQVARTAVHVDGQLVALEASPPPSTNALRVAAALTGRWIDQPSPGCDPDRGRHADGCPHRARYMFTSLRELAREAFGNGSGANTRRVVAALGELASNATRVSVFDRAQRRIVGRFAATVGEFAQLDRAVRWGWGASTHESLLAGGYTRLPRPIVQGLSGADFLVWQAILTHPVLRHMRPSEERDLSLTGALHPHRLGLRRYNRPAKVRAALARGLDRGNGLQDVVHASLSTRARSRGPGILVRKREDAGCVIQGTQTRNPEDAPERETGPQVVFKAEHEERLATVPEHEGSLRSRDHDGVAPGRGVAGSRRRSRGRSPSRRACQRRSRRGARRRRSTA